MKTILTLLAVVALFTGCSTTTIEHAEITEATFNSASWKSQAGVDGDARIDATTAPQTDASLTGL
jgi:uncharacterized lipoprotein YajG